MKKKHTANHGFTLIEIIIMLMVLGVMVAVAVNHVAKKQADVISSADVLKSHLRYAQAMAMNSNSSRIWGIQFISETATIKYYPFSIATSADTDDKNNTPDNIVNRRLPSSVKDDNLYYEFEKGVRIKKGNIFLKTYKGKKVNNIYFDNFGRPYMALEPDCSDSKKRLAKDFSFILINNDNVQREIILTADTGYIQ